VFSALLEAFPRFFLPDARPNAKVSPNFFSSFINFVALDSASMRQREEVM
jgi:hypothetical protein